MSRLIIAEKPSLGRAIAAALPNPQKKQQGYIECGNGDIVTWCMGHLLEQVEPEAYDSRYKRWNLADLPIVPQQWQLKPRKSASKQLAVVKKLLKSAAHIVHAGDPDREGQLLVDEVINYCRVPQAKKESMQRLLISDLNLPAVKRALSQLRSNRDFVPLSISALARSRADWLYGMNLSRAYTLLGKKAGYQGVLSVGRVQTPVLGLVVRRELEIEAFVPKDNFTLHAVIPHQGIDIRAKWQPSEACRPWQDEEGRILNPKLVENVARRIANQPATVMESEQKPSKQAPPLPYSLSALQIDAAKRYGMSAQQVLDTCQSLYEKHKLITYPRSDCRYLPVEHYAQAQSVCSAISNNSAELKEAVMEANLSLKSKAWNDKKVEAHHAIIPTPKQLKTKTLAGPEEKIYQLIARQYLMQFYPHAEYANAKLVFEIAGGSFVAKGRQLVIAGWKSLLGQSNEKERSPEKGIDAVPPLPKGEQLLCREGEIKACKTEPPKSFTEATLLQAMTGIGRFVQDKALKQILKETDGLGTEATRAGILATLFKRQLLVRKGKSITCSAAGRGLIAVLPAQATYPDMTAHWEHQLQGMAERNQAYQPFMSALQIQVDELVAQVKGTEQAPKEFEGLAAVKVKRSFKKRRRKACS